LHQQKPQQKKLPRKIVMTKVQNQKLKCFQKKKPKGTATNGTNGKAPVNKESAIAKTNQKVAKKVASPSESSEDEAPKKVVAKPAANGTKKPAPKKVESDSESDEAPVTKKPVAKTTTKPAAKKVESDSESSEAPVTKKPVAKTAVKPVAKKVESSEEDSDDEPVTKKPVAKTVAKKAESSDEESDEVVQQVKKPVATAKPVASDSDCKELFCKNLSWNTDENVLTTFFGKYGSVVNVKVLYDKMTGKARGLGFVEFGTREEAQAALDDAASLEVDGRLIQVTFSDQKPERTGAPAYGQGGQGGYGAQKSYGQQSGGYGGQQSGGYGQQQQRSNYDGERHAAFVGNLGFRTNEGSVRSFFGDCGNVVDVRIAKSEDGKSRGFCHVDFDSSDALQKSYC